MKRLLILFLTLLILLCSCSTGNSNKNKTKNSKVTITASDKLKSKFDDVLLENGFTGTTCIFYKGKKIYVGNRGYANKDKMIENNTNLIYRIASLSKQFTAAGICILYDEGKLDLDDTIDKYFPEYTYGKYITIRNLLNMSSGIPNFTGDLELTYSKYYLNIDISADKSANENKLAIKKWILSQKLTFKPGTKFEYSNSNYNLLGYIVQEASGKSYENFITEKIFKPLKMTSTSFDSTNLNTKGYVYDSDQTEMQRLIEENVEWLMYPGVQFAFADICSSVEDLYKWVTALKGGKIMKQKTLDMMFESNDLGYGFGFFTTKKSCGHTGSWGSYQSEIYFLKHKNLIIIALSNTYSKLFYNDIIKQLNYVINDNSKLLPK